MKFKEIEHPFLGGIETPLICRALRYGAVLKLEDLYMPYIQAVDMIAQTVKSQLRKKEDIPATIIDDAATDTDLDVACTQDSFVAVNPMKDQVVIPEENLHYMRTVSIEKAKQTANDIKLAAKEDFKEICHVHAKEMATFEEENEEKSGLFKALTGSEACFKYLSLIHI